jgi:hypothetical protein
MPAIRARPRRPMENESSASGAQQPGFHIMSVGIRENDMSQAACSNKSAITVSLKDMRKSVRTNGPFQVRMRGFDKSGNAFHANSLVNNISSKGLYMLLGRPVAKGAMLFVVVQLKNGTAIAAHGRVNRVERQANGFYGVAVRFTRAQLLPVQATSSHCLQTFSSNG